MCVCVCVCVCARAHVCVCVSVRACMYNIPTCTLPYLSTYTVHSVHQHPLTCTRVHTLGRDFPTLQSLCMDAISNNFNVLSKRLLQLRGSPLLTEVKEYHRKKGYYSHIQLESRPDDLNYGGDRVHFLCGVGYGRAIPTPAR